MKKSDQANAIKPEQNHFLGKGQQDQNERNQDDEFARVLSQVDFSRGSPVRERVRARVLDKARNEFDGKQLGRRWARTSRTAFVYIGGALLLVVAAILFGWLIERLIPSQGALPASNPTATATTITPTPTATSPTPAPMFGPTRDILYLSNADVIANNGGLETAVRSGPGMRYAQVGQLKDGEQAAALGKTSLGEWIKIVYPGTPDGTGWVYADQIKITGDELPIIADASAYPPGITSGAKLLGMQSSPEEIRNLILHPIWSVVWVDGQAVHYNSNGGTIRFFVQAWLEKTGGGRVISSNQMENVTMRNPELLPKWVWLSDGKAPQGYDIETKTFDSSMGNMRWNVHPLEMAGELMQILFPYFLEHKGDQPIQAVREETFAGQPALVIDWGESRFWVDETSGVILRQQGFYSTPEHTGQADSDLFLSQIRYQSRLPGDLLDPSKLDQLRFQEAPIEPATVPQGQPEALDAIRKFSHQEVTNFTVQIGTMNPNVPGSKVDQYTVNGATYDIDPQSYRIVEFIDTRNVTEDSQTYPPETLEQMAVRLVQEQLPNINLQDYKLERANKSGKNYFFRWSLGAAGEPGYLTFIQVGYTLHGKLFGYINALPPVNANPPSGTPTTLPFTVTPAASGRPTGKVYFSVDSSGDPWTKIAWLSLDCLAGQNACQPAIQTLPISVQKNMAGKLAWSPDGKQFALESNSDGNDTQDILVADASGEHPLNLTHSPEREINTAWSPDGAYLLYIKIFTVDNTSRSEIWVSRPDGADQRKIADGNVAAWSPDGRQILYAAAEGPAGKPIIAIAYRAGGDPVWGKTLQNSVRDLAWSPDGSKFVISSVDGIFSMDRDGSHATQLAPDLVGISNTVWSQGSQWIAFFAHASRQAPPNLYTIRADGSGLVNLTNSNLGGQFGFSWSPDGNWLVYDSTKDSGHGNIFVSNPDGSKQYRLTQSDGSLEYLTPSWQPGI